MTERACATAGSGSLEGSQAAVRIGAHVSLGADPRAIIVRMREEGFGCLQIHASSPRTWRRPDGLQEKFALIRQVCEEVGMDLYLHAIYLLNLGSDDPVIYQGSIDQLVWNMGAASDLGAQAVTFHVGSHLGRGFEETRAQVGAGITSVLERSPLGPTLLLENSAGAGFCIGSKIPELGAIIADVGYPSRLGICIDTAHAFATGYNLRCADDIDLLIQEIDLSVGLDRLRLLHVNDSKTELGSNRDRHESIGDGLIGVEGFKRLLARPEFNSLPMVMETPNVEKRPAELAMVLHFCTPGAGAPESMPDE